ncbi:MAG: sigma-54-dependent Fis family transcriptional regulator [Lentisphaerae bacterium]|nr:sigma-54-dependent Fis family transcriptional regulator [Lentisphaerota bacterium]
MRATVLLVDDDPVDLNALRLLVESWDHHVILANSGAEALERLDAGAVDVVLSDLRMPHMDGLALAQSVGAQHPHLPFLLITGQADVASAVGALRQGVFDYIVKPPNTDELQATLARAIEYGRLHRENTLLKAQLGTDGMYGERLVGGSPCMLELYDLVERVAPTDSTVLITGETGTGKELVAQAIHYRSRRADRPLIAMNCAATNANLIESELFGYEKGAFTGAVTARRGRFETADGGTLFLDEIAETAPEFQTKLLRVLQEGVLERVGGSQPIPVDVRVVASTHRDLSEEVKAGRFREDLYYRLRVIPVCVPPLRARGDDVLLLARHFLARYADRYGGSPRALTPEAEAFLLASPWPGNVRELQHAIERAVVLGHSDVIHAEDLRMPTAPHAPPQETALADFIDRQTREQVVRVLDSCGWRKGRAAKALAIDRATLYRMIRKWDIESPTE